MSKLALSLIGRPLITRDGVPITITSRKTVALITYLAVTAESHHRDKLATLFWPRLPKSHARAALRKTLMEARQALGDEWLESDGEIVGLDFTNDLWLDVRQFNAVLGTLEKRSAAGGRENVRHLEEAAELYRSDFLSGLLLDSNSMFSEWQYFEAEAIRKQAIAILDRLVEAHIEGCEPSVAIEYARRRLAIDPDDEAAHRRLMGLYAATGQHSLGIRQYRDCCRRLERDIGVKPDAETESLYRDIVARKHVALERLRAGHGERVVAQTPPGAPRRLLTFVRKRRCALIAGAAGLVVLVTGAIVLGRVAGGPRPVVVVFPIEPLSQDRDSSLISIGVTDALVVALVQIPGLAVQSTASSDTDTGKDGGALLAAATAGGASHYVEGRLYRLDEMVRVSLKLVDVRTQTVLWAEEYLRRAADLLAVRGEVADDAAAGIAENLRLKGGRARPGSGQSP